MRDPTWKLKKMCCRMALRCCSPWRRERIAVSLQCRHGRGCSSAHEKSVSTVPAAEKLFPAVKTELSGGLTQSSSLSRGRPSANSIWCARVGLQMACSKESMPVFSSLPLNGVPNTWVVSKSSGMSRDLSLQSRSFLVNRLDFARL